MTGGFHAKDTRGITDVFEYKAYKRICTFVCSCKAERMSDLPAFRRNNGSFMMIFANIQLIRKILQSRGSSLRLRGHKCLKSGDAHLYLLQDDCDIGRLIWLVIY
jgi:hypothetical protein